ncbi:hepatocyte growth factor-regulated tyrosine kinase substrate isoform X2 [Planococcus citri]|uniref:hepatocyte growth factor-regulated tyrosine kinase substrate isoform X2 n=1 Tax=Planococcus citri TaxID=170843 RepID=UPI0031FA29FF
MVAKMLRKPTFEQFLNEATDSYRLETDWDVIMKLCDLIRQGDVKPNNALNAIQKKISNPNSVVALYGLTVLESCVKNCGALIQDEISTKQFMETFKDIIKSCQNENVRTKCLDLLQSWAFAFRNNPKHRSVQDTVTIMKTEGYKFPTFKESDAMFLADTAPSWKDGDRCHRCRTMFTLMNRKHHCRACGEVFCQQCSSHSITLPKFGIEKSVRVCDTCLEKCQNSMISHNDSVIDGSHQKTIRSSFKSRKSSPWSSMTLKPSSAMKAEESEYGTNTSTPTQPRSAPKKTDEELKEEEELQLAIALSQSEAESKTRAQPYKPVTRSKSFSPPVVQHKLADSFENDDVELSRYLNRTYWDARASTGGEKTRDSLGSANTVGLNNTSHSNLRDEKSLPIDMKSMSIYDYDTMHRDKTASDENGVETPDEMEYFVNTLNNQVEIFVNRMKSNASRGRSIANDTTAQNLFLNITAMHSQLLRYIQQQDDSRVYYEGLQDKLTQVKDARAALDALRDEHKERLRREAEIAERQRQLQMAQKLEIMRQKKQEYLQYQRQLALKRIHDQERELHMRQEQQIQQYRLNNTYGSLPYIPPAQPSGVSAFEPVAVSMQAMNLPASTANSGPFASSTSFAAPHYTAGQNTMPHQPPQTVMMGQSQIPASNVYAPSSNPLMSGASGGPGGPAPSQPLATGSNASNVGGPPPPHTHQMIGQPAAANPQYVSSPQATALHSGPGHHIHQPAPQSGVYVDHQQPGPASGPGIHMDQNLQHVMGPPASSTNRPAGSEPPQGHMPSAAQPVPAAAASLMQHTMGRSVMAPPSSSPLSSPSSSSEHSLIQHGPQPVPSAPSATSTPQPEEKDEIAELISFD